jgi:hypothetical protein
VGKVQSYIYIQVRAFQEFHCDLSPEMGEEIAWNQGEGRIANRKRE